MTVRARGAAAPPQGSVPAVVDGKRLPVVADDVRREVRFPSGRHTLAGHLYPAQGERPGRRGPALAMAGPMTSVKEETLPHYAQPLAAAGFTVLTFDNRNFGASQGDRPQHLDTYEQVEDLKNALTYLLSRDDVDADRVGLACVCLGAGYGMEVAAFDPRVKAVALIAGGYNISDTYADMLGMEGVRNYLVNLADMRQRHALTGEQQWIDAVAPPPGYGPSSMPIREAYEYYTSAHDREASRWQNRLTYESMETLLAWNVTGHAHLVTQPMLVVHGTVDPLLPPRFAQQVYDEAASTDKDLVWVETHNHVEFYDQEPYVSQALAAVIPFLSKRLSAAAHQQETT